MKTILKLGLTTITATGFLFLAACEPVQLKGDDAYREGHSQGRDWAFNHLKDDDSIYNYYVDKVANRKANEDSEVVDKNQFIEGFTDGATEGEQKKREIELAVVAKVLHENGL